MLKDILKILERKREKFTEKFATMYEEVIAIAEEL